MELQITVTWKRTAKKCSWISIIHSLSWQVTDLPRNTSYWLERSRNRGSPFFFIRTKIDENVRAEIRKKSFSEAAVLQKIRRNCKENLVDEAGNPISSEDDIFLISNHHPDKWDFSRLTEAIPTLSLNALTSLSKGILKRKVEVLKRRMIL